MEEFIVPIVKPDDVLLSRNHQGTGETGPARLTSTQRADYDRDGYVAFPVIATQDDVLRVRAVYDTLFAEKRGWEKGDFFETGGDFGDAVPVLPQMNWLSRYEPGLCDSSFHRNALGIARELLGPSAELVWEFAIMKPAFTGGETSAHQDEASFTRETDYSRAVTVWMPLQDVDLRNGCMEYVQGSHLGLLHPHRSVGGDVRAHGLEAIVPDSPTFTPVPLRAGDAVIHHSRTLHYAGRNLSTLPRRAYILEFAVRSDEQAMAESHPWILAKRTARDARQRSATPARQLVIERLRRIRKGTRRFLRRRLGGVSVRGPTPLP